MGIEDRILSKDLITKYNNQINVNDLSNELEKWNMKWKLIIRII